MIFDTTITVLGDRDRKKCERLWTLLKQLNPRFSYDKNELVFTNPELAYLINFTRLEVVSFNWMLGMTVTTITIDDFLRAHQFLVGDKVCLVGVPDSEIREIDDITLSGSNEILYKVSRKDGGYNYIKPGDLERAVIPEENIVGWRCAYCGKIMRFRKPHMCGGSYRCKKLLFAPVKEENGYIELPEGYEIDGVVDNKIVLKKK